MFSLFSHLFWLSIFKIPCCLTSGECCTDFIDFPLESQQNADGGFATYELTRSYRWVEVTLINTDAILLFSPEVAPWMWHIQSMTHSLPISRKLGSKMNVHIKSIHVKSFTEYARFLVLFLKFLIMNSVFYKFCFLLILNYLNILNSYTFIHSSCRRLNCWCTKFINW